jgi:hypothetical protein
MKTAGTQLTKSFATAPAVSLLAGSLLMAGSRLTAFGTDVFTVDPSQSRVTLSGSAIGASFYAQAAGSLTTEYTGTLLAEVGDNAIRFPGQSHVVALDSGSWQPLENGSAGSALANYGASASYFSATGVAAARDLQVDFSSGALALVNGRFDTQGITVSIPDGAASSVAYRVQGAINKSGAISLAGGSATGQAAQGSVVTAGSLQVLTIPIHYSFYFSLMSPNDTTVTVTGQLVATRTL